MSPAEMLARRVILSPLLALSTQKPISESPPVRGVVLGTVYDDSVWMSSG
jgi:hypothetical protein